MTDKDMKDLEKIIEAAYEIYAKLQKIYMREKGVEHKWLK